MKGIFLSFFFLLIANLLVGQYEIKGHVENKDGERLASAAVYIDGTSKGVLTDEQGAFVMTDVEKGNYIIKASYLGFETASTSISIIEDTTIEFLLQGSMFGLEEIEINGTWVRKNMPFSHKNLNKKEFTRYNLGQDIPYLLKNTPSMVVTSDAGAGVGYTGMRIRGSDPSRINVTINGIPLNDSESQSVFWVDLPDFASSAQEIQIQRGVGPSTNGTSAFGATINLNTNKLRIKPYLNIGSSFGSFNTAKLNVSGGTGLMNNKFGIDVSYSVINSDGYVDRASSKLSSLYLAGNYITEKSSLSLNVISGSEITYQAWNGLPYQLNQGNVSNSTYNSAGTEKPGDPYENEVDDYNQDHVQLHYNRAINDNLNLNVSGHYTRGLGFFENYKGSRDLNDYNIPDTSGEKYDVVIKRWLDNHFYGTIVELDWKDLEDKHNLIWGGSINNYIGKHFGQSVWNSRDGTEPVSTEFSPIEYYRNEASKLDFNTYGKWTYRFHNRFISYLDLQYRLVDYTFQGFNPEGEIVDQNEQLNFFNPKIGMSYLLDNDSKLYVSYGIANREPNRNDYTESSLISRPQAERLYDLELGYSLQTKMFGAAVNIYNMQYDNQLVLTGEINDVGAYTRTNVKDSYRRGMEFDGGLNDFKGAHLLLNATISQNRINNFTEYIDSWDTGEQIEVTHELTDLAFSPAFIFANDVGYEFLRNNKRHSASVSLVTKYVGKQYIDNTSNEYAELAAYNYSDLLVNYTIKGNRFFKSIQFNLNIHNITNTKYVSNAWVYRFSSVGYDPVPNDKYARAEYDVDKGGDQYNLTGLYPQARIYFLAGVSFMF